MPFLPSEGQPGKMVIDNEVQDVILFRYLPSLWYSHPIPNSLKEFWYTERTDILNFMKKNYSHLEIEFLPDRIVKGMTQSQILKPIANNLADLSSNIICQIDIHSEKITNIFTEKSELLLSFTVDKFIT
jgi:hypothetical protein